MATITACTAPTSSFVHKRIVASPAASSVLGLPSIAKKGVVRCSMEQRPTAEETSSSKKVGMSGSLLAAACAATMSSPALALVDERMTTEGVGLPLGFSNNLLGWLLLGVFGLIWSFYIVYTSSLDEDEESGLSL
ncbi:hypothetical protein Vadar_001952 [Vaccinium darrowii]|uniref:Uncharacterized protein n=1 Tax=Vaccinium darrowii TaxID=229202 RepID=A0ACB7Z975_9ERIC|nr:hypothetical protein Vadar_001952 [Vaccinium darrowii]